MTTFAQVRDGRVLAHFTKDCTLAEAQAMFADIAHELHEAPADVQDGWELVDGYCGPVRTAAAEVWEQIKAIRDRLSDTGGYSVTVDGTPKWFHSDPKSKTQQLALTMLGANVPAVQWKTMDGTFVTMSQSLAGAIFQAAMQMDMALFAHAETLRAQVNAAQDPSSVDINAGWPATYGGS